MPNHITNILSFKGNEEYIIRLKTFIKSNDEQLIDFKKIVPFPKELENTVSPTRKYITAEEYILQEERLARNELTEDEKKWGISRYLTKELSEEYINKFGSDNWYDWSRHNWDTKWNAYDTYDNGEDISFDTAWSCPYNVILQLSKLFPEVNITLQYADEDIGQNVGVIEFYNGEEVDRNIPEDEDEALELAANIKGDDYYLNGEYLREILEDGGSVEEEFSKRLLRIMYKNNDLDSSNIDILESLLKLAIENNDLSKQETIRSNINKKTS